MLDLLKEVRESEGLSLKDVSDALRIRECYLEAIERKDPSCMPELVYVIGFVKSYAKFLGLCGDDMIEEVRSLVCQEVGHVTADHVPKAADDTAQKSGLFSTFLTWLSSSFQDAEKLAESEDGSSAAPTVSDQHEVGADNDKTLILQASTPKISDGLVQDGEIACESPVEEQPCNCSRSS
ncbi:hypothetical protein FACS189449_12230 [Alphaproteobacteria bacterium]|nr:hypothetical protein FACS189449_12230 [Alphaproteobacteria bacterium]